jgi:hypothetical protein
MRRIDTALTAFANDPRLTHIAVQTEAPGSDSVRWLEPVGVSPWSVAR